MITKGKVITVEHPPTPWTKERKTRGKVIQVTDHHFTVRREGGYGISFTFNEKYIGVVRVKEGE